MAPAVPRSRRVWFAGVATITWVGVVLSYAICCWDQFKVLTPNMVGDFFAGVVAPLAFLWLVIGYFQQGDELRQNAEALRLQAEQLRLQVEETKALVAEAKRQAEAALKLYEIEKVKHEVELHAQRVRAQPKLQFNGSRLSQRLYDLTLRNIGGPITGLRLLHDKRVERAQKAGPDFLLANQDITLHVLMHKAPDDEAFTVWLDFTDALGSPGRAAIKVWFKEGNASITIDLADEDEMGVLTDVVQQ